MIELLHEIELRASRGINGGNLTEAVLALTSIVGLAKRAQDDQQRAETLAAGMTPASQSSVQIEETATGPRVTVTVYDQDVTVAAERATREYERLVGDGVAV